MNLPVAQSSCCKVRCPSGRERTHTWPEISFSTTTLSSYHPIWVVLKVLKVS